MKQPYWIIFLKDPATGVITGTAYPHNATGDYKTNPYYVGTQRIKINLANLRS